MLWNAAYDQGLHCLLHISPFIPELPVDWSIYEIEYVHDLSKGYHIDKNQN